MSQIPRDRGGWRRLLKRVSRATRNSDQAEDFLHAAFLRMEAYSARRPVENPAGFLVRAATNIAADEARHNVVRALAGAPVEEIPGLADPRPLQDEVLAARERLERVRSGLNQLSPRTREVFLMHRLDGMKYREIAEELGVTVSAVEKHVAKAALFLANWIEGW
jgi:RNA polymerase sigma factor (sigma-70 family)